MKKMEWTKKAAWVMVMVMMLSCFGVAFAEAPQETEEVEEEIVFTIEEEEESAESSQMEQPEQVVENTLPSEPVVKEEIKVETKTETTVDFVTEETKEEIKPEPVYHDVTFVIGESKTIVTVEQGTAVEKPTMSPVMEGFLFMHWYNVKSNEQNPFDFSTPIVDKVTLAAYFEEIVTDDTQNFIDEDGKVVTANETTMLPSSENGSVIGELENTLGLSILVVEGEAEEALKTEATDGEEDSLDGEEFIIEDYETPLAGGQSVRVWMTVAGDVAYYGDMVTLHSELVGYDGLDVSMQWYCNGVPVGGATGAQHVFELTQENETWVWQLDVNVIR